MFKKKFYDAVVVGSGPNGLAAAATLAKDHSVLVIEAKSTLGGGMRSGELTLPGFVHDICSAVHPLAKASPFFSQLPLKKFGLNWIEPLAPLAHPFEDGSVVMLERSIEETSKGLLEDAKAYRNLMEPLVEDWPKISGNILGPLRFPTHPIAMIRFAYLGIKSAQGLANQYFKGSRAKGLFAGLAAHAIQPLTRPLTAAFGLTLGMLGHAVGWPIPQGGSQNIANALAAYLNSLGCEMRTGLNIESFEQLPEAKVVLFDLSPKQVLKIVGDRFPGNYQRKLEKYQYGPGIFKMDWALSNPIPWKAKECLHAGTVHLGGSFEDIARSEQEVWLGKHPEKSFIILAQPSLFDSTRTPSEKHTTWAYCHVPNGSTFDMTSRIEEQIERYAPGFKECILARSSINAAQLEEYNSNDIGGDITGGVQNIQQLFSRPVSFIHPYATPLKNLFFCSASTPPGGGVHGMCGFHAAQAALKML